MNKYLSKIVGAVASLAMVIGVGVGIASNKESTMLDATSSEWELVTSSLADWTGEYILCNGTSGTVKMMDGSSFDTGSCAGVDVVVTNGKINADDSDSLTIAKSTTEGKYTIKVNGKFIGRNANSNGLDSADTWTTSYNNAISYSDSKITIAGNGGRTLTWYASNSNFRYYASSNNSSQLFRKVTSGGNTPSLSTIAISKPHLQSHPLFEAVLSQSRLQAIHFLSLKPLPSAHTQY